MLCQKSPTLSKIRPVIHESQCSSLFRKCEALLRKYQVLLRRFGVLYSLRRGVFATTHVSTEPYVLQRALLRESPERVLLRDYIYVTQEPYVLCVKRALRSVKLGLSVIHASQCTSLLRKYTNLLLNCRALLQPHDIFGDKIQSMHIQFFWPTLYIILYMLIFVYTDFGIQASASGQREPVGGQKWLES